MFRYVRILLIPLLLLGVACNRDPKAQSMKLVENGNKFFAKGKFKEASIMYRRALAKDQKNGEAYFRLGLTSEKLGAWSDAAAAFRRTIDIQKNNTTAMTKLGDIYWMAWGAQPTERNKNLLLELDELSKDLLRNDPKSFDGFRFAGYLALARKNFDDALKAFESAEKAKPFDPDLGLVHAQVLGITKRLGDAEQLARGILEKNKNYAPIYRLLVELYISQNRVKDAEDVLKLQVQNNAKQDNPRITLAAFYQATRRPEDMERTVQEMLSNQKDFPWAHLRVGAFFMTFNDFDRARREFEAGVAEGGEKKRTYQQAIVDLLARQNRPTEALALAEELVKADPKDPVSLAQRSALSVGSGDQQKMNAAVSDLQGLVSKNPTNAIYRFQLARALVAKGQQDEARTHLEESLRLRPTQQARLLLAQIYANKGEYPKAIELADTSIKEEPGNVAARVIRTASLLGMKDVKRAKEELEAIIKAAPNTSDALFQLALINFGEKNFKESTTLFEQMRKSNPNDQRGAIGLMETAIAQGNHAAAIQMARDTLAKDPSRRDAKVQLANVLVRSGQYDEALGIFQQLAQNDPKSPEFAIKLGETYRLKGDFNAAIENYKKAVALAPNQTGPQMRVALMLETVGRRNEAKPIYEQVLRQDPTNVVALNNLAFIKAEEGSDLDQALVYAQRAKAKVPNDTNVADTLGWVYIKKNLSDDAVRVFQDLVKQDPTNSTYRYHLAMALFQKGDRPNAKKHCEQALQNNPSKEESGKIKELLNKIG